MSRFPYSVAEIFRSYCDGAFPTLNPAGAFILYRPRTRALLPVSGLHVAKTLQQTLRKGHLRTTFDQAFDRVVEGCVRTEDNWITPELRHIYGAIHRAGWGHSVECWREDELVGGLYGLAIGGAFFYESAFSRAPDASKVATVALVQELRAQGFALVDIQMLSEHLARMGAYEVSDATFGTQLAPALAARTRWGTTREALAAAVFPPRLTTSRLVLRPLGAADAPAYYGFLRDPEVHRYTLERPPESEADARRHIETHVAEHYRRGVPDPLAICLAADERALIGTIGCFKPQAGLPTLEMAFDLARPYWGQGLAAEAARAMMRYAFEAFPIARLQARCTDENQASDRLLRALGMSYEGTLRDAMDFGGRLWSMRSYAMLRAEHERGGAVSARATPRSARESAEF